MVKQQLAVCHLCLIRFDDIGLRLIVVLLDGHLVNRIIIGRAGLGLDVIPLFQRDTDGGVHRLAPNQRRVAVRIPENIVGCEDARGVEMMQGHAALILVQPLCGHDTGGVEILGMAVLIDGGRFVTGELYGDLAVNRFCGVVGAVRHIIGKSRTSVLVGADDLRFSVGVNRQLHAGCGGAVEIGQRHGDGRTAVIERVAGTVIVDGQRVYRLFLLCDAQGAVEIDVSVTVRQRKGDGARQPVLHREAAGKAAVRQNRDTGTGIASGNGEGQCIGQVLCGICPSENAVEVHCIVGEIHRAVGIEMHAIGFPLGFAGKGGAEDEAVTFVGDVQKRGVGPCFRGQIRKAVGIGDSFRRCGCGYLAVGIPQGVFKQECRNGCPFDSGTAFGGVHPDEGFASGIGADMLGIGAQRRDLNDGLDCDGVIQCAAVGVCSTVQLDQINAFVKHRQIEPSVFAVSPVVRDDLFRRTLPDRLQAVCREQAVRVINVCAALRHRMEQSLPQRVGGRIGVDGCGDIKGRDGGIASAGAVQIIVEHSGSTGRGQHLIFRAEADR